MKALVWVSQAYQKGIAIAYDAKGGAGSTLLSEIKINRVSLPQLSKQITLITQIK